MKQEKSCGVIPYIVINNEIRFVLVKQNNGFICFPKGHVEEGETERDTALRELKEETGLTVDLLEGFREVVSYYMPDYDAVKDVGGSYKAIHACCHKQKVSYMGYIWRYEVCDIEPEILNKIQFKRHEVNKI